MLKKLNRWKAFFPDYFKSYKRVGYGMATSAIVNMPGYKTQALVPL